MDNKLIVLNIAAEVAAGTGVINPVLFWNGDDALLVDAGFPKQEDVILEAIRKNSVPLEKLTKIVITHHDIDHIGGLRKIADTLPNYPTIYSHEVEVPYIEGKKEALKLAGLRQKAKASGEEGVQKMYENLKKGFEYCLTPVDETLVDGETLPFFGGIKVVFTPGHTLGHICLYHNETKTLIAGDELTIKEGKLVVAAPNIFYDYEMGKESLKKLLDFDISTVVCYHGGIYDNEVNRTIKDLCK